ncbi:MAG: Mannose-phosphate guanylyltransferase [Myxococcaceae bacterium]|nr:Mannose-phosphate guanylyltransferase [Myxococcaceae bacterium]
MRALIFEQAGAIGVGAFDLAGRPLLVRQLQWLRDQGIEDVVVEVAIGSAAAERGALLLGTDPLTARCVVIPTRCAIGVQALAARVGLADDELFLALPADILVQAPLELPSEPALFGLPLPSSVAQPPVQLAFQTRVRAPLELTELHEGWAVRIGDLALAHATSCAVLTGSARGILVHAAEIKPGVWLARGARVSEDATLLGPVLIGPDARVLGSARVGPNVLVGRQSVIERDAVLSDAVVARGTLVGEGMRVRQAQVDARGITSFADLTRTAVDDPLQLASAAQRGPLLTSRLVALLLGLLLLLPWTLGFSLTALSSRRIVRKVSWRGRDLHVGTIGLALLDLVPALYDVVLGRRDLVGVASVRALELEGGRGDGPVRGGALDVSSALAPSASTSTLLWMWRWYLENKTAKLDRKLWWRQRIARSARSTAEKKSSP